ncbi:MAG: hypothetical protein O3A00_02110 [Planctomycetota bacterium]|nr:hypothetical protein [Planctomycetota bacterium]
MKRMLLGIMLLAGIHGGRTDGFAAETGDLIKAIKTVGGKGEGHAAAIKSLKLLQAADASALPEIVKAFDGAGVLAANWLRSAFESVADRAITNKAPFPAKQLEALVKDTTQDARARRLAYEWLLKVDSGLDDRLIPSLLEDPSADFRRDAVARLLSEAETQLAAKKIDEAKATYRTALRGAVHDDQVKQIVAALKKQGETVDLQAHFGFLGQWNLIGPFDNKDKKGFPVVYPPEKEIKPDATYKGQLGDVKWQPLKTDDGYGVIDIGKQLENYKGSLMYAETKVDSPQDQHVQFRLGTANSWKLWVNGKLIFAREEYHRGMRMDQYRLDVDLKQGQNVILLKILQNEQTEDWAQRYQFQLRICDAAGSAALGKN